MHITKVSIFTRPVTYFVEESLAKNSYRPAYIIENIARFRQQRRQRSKVQLLITNPLKAVVPQDIPVDDDWFIQ